MRHFLSLFIILGLSISLQAESLRGFLLTKDNYQLTGYFNVLSYSPTGNMITFTNDFGDVYSIHPMLVKGFGFSKDGTSFRFVSRFHEGQWFFLHEEVTGRALSLFRLPDGSNNWVDDSMLRLFQTPPPTYYFYYGNRNLVAIPRSGFKRTLKKFFERSSPELSAKIGKRGYRYRNLAEIVVEFNELKGRARRRL
ncbi:hypothetical protein FUA23_12160 [Neolewinella aurantiaca]|uniref:Uncharacterized protein n=1 Tax=Neolewinella aurantiaca TaxID=2602767 RepID=A0A5C7FS80_9BACT|nr:hypothetical protein [Neolewinella aurantiaca]TXF89034.1 hypothetical protein FUA23_12160 [Neolewinella aurantiaca]